MKEFFKKLLSENGDVSSKRFVGLIAFFLVGFVVITDLFTKHHLTEYMFWGLISIVASAFGMNTIISVIDKINKGKNNAK